MDDDATHQVGKAREGRFCGGGECNVYGGRLLRVHLHFIYKVKKETLFSTLRARDNSRAVIRQLRSRVNQHCWLQVG